MSTTIARMISRVAPLVLAGILLAIGSGCGRQNEQAQQTAAPGAQAPAGGETALCNFKAGPDDAAIVVNAYYPGRHEDTLAAVKALVDKFPGTVQVEIIDWRTEEGLKRRDDAGLTCAGVTVNGKNAFDLEIDGTATKVLFVRGINGEWTEEDLEAAVRQVLASAAKE